MYYLIPILHLKSILSSYYMHLSLLNLIKEIRKEEKSIEKKKKEKNYYFNFSS